LDGWASNDWMSNGEGGSDGKLMFGWSGRLVLKGVDKVLSS